MRKQVRERNGEPRNEVAASATKKPGGAGLGGMPRLSYGDLPKTSAVVTPTTVVPPRTAATVSWPSMASHALTPIAPAAKTKPRSRAAILSTNMKIWDRSAVRRAVAAFSSAIWTMRSGKLRSISPYPANVLGAGKGPLWASATAISTETPT